MRVQECLVRQGIFREKIIDDDGLKRRKKEKNGKEITKGQSVKILNYK